MLSRSARIIPLTGSLGYRHFASSALAFSSESPELNIHAGRSSQGDATTTAASLNVQVPTTDRLDTLRESHQGLPGVFSKRTFDDVWSKQTAVKLEDLKYGISESPSRADLESCFVTESSSSSSARARASDAMNPFLRNSRRSNGGLNGSSSSLIEDYTLSTSNKVADQYYRLLKKTSKQPTEDFVFQSASSIYNLFYFLSSLKPNEGPENQFSKEQLKKDLLKTPDIFAPIENQPPHGELSKWIVKSFGSLEEFKTLLLSSANSIAGNGYTWVVHRFIKPQQGHQTRDLTRFSSLAVVNTYNNGTPHQFRSGQISSARRYHEKRSMIENQNSAEEMFNMNQIEIPTIAEAQDSYEMFEFTYEPLLAVGVNPSFYVRDYGVFGKKRYLENVWNSIDWATVEGRLN
ncbi:DEKNAAC102860 [Brettanomyces naardenensis]|uniref:DEKNAAC102860 n=1 Tax=Brettanomyces naardenensis TaxID=13370 RepID=A0A448YLP3_BRENA|nr:DEKNAAC102860 [Brettanomyces naardenensis]